MFLQVRRILSFEHRRTVSAVDGVHFADAHVGVYEVLKVLPNRTVASSSDVLRVPSPVADAATGKGVRGHTQSVHFRMETFDVFLQVCGIFSFQYCTAQTDVRVYFTDALVARRKVFEEGPNWTRSRPTCKTFLRNLTSKQWCHQAWDTGDVPP